jgi:hypothetical protein
MNQKAILIGASALIIGGFAFRTWEELKPTTNITLGSVQKTGKINKTAKPKDVSDLTNENWGKKETKFKKAIAIQESWAEKETDIPQKTQVEIVNTELWKTSNLTKPTTTSTPTANIAVSESWKKEEEPLAIPIEIPKKTIKGLNFTDKWNNTKDIPITTPPPRPPLQLELKENWNSKK